MKTILGKKVGMTQIFTDQGAVIPVTVIEAGPMTVTQVKTVETDGYDAVQFGFEDAKPQRVNKPMTGHFEKAGVAPKKHLAEFKPEEGEVYEPGQQITVADFEEGAKLDVTGTSKGKGTQGNIKRHGHHRGPMSHGSKHRETCRCPCRRYLSFQSIQGQRGSGKNGTRDSDRSERDAGKSYRREEPYAGKGRGSGTQRRNSTRSVRGKGSGQQIEKTSGRRK